MAVWFAPREIVHPVEGDEFPVSGWAFLRWSLLSLVFVLAGFLCFYMIGKTGLPRSRLILVGLLLIGGGLIGVAVNIGRTFRHRRLILGDECVQFVEGNELVLGQIPYDNIADLKFLNHRTRKGVAIVCVQPLRPDTFWSGAGSVFDDSMEYQCDVIIGYGLTLPPRRVFDQLLARWRGFGELEETAR